MAESEIPHERRLSTRLIGLLLLAAAAAWAAVLLAWAGGFFSSTTGQPAASTPVISATEEITVVTVESNNSLVPTVDMARATPWEAAGLGSAEIATLTATPPTLSAVPVVLLGPPPGSEFSVDSPVTFYWQWPEPLENNWYFSLYVRTAEAEHRIASVDEPNLGTLYQVQATLGEHIEGGGLAAWFVRVEDGTGGALLAQSDERAISLRDG